MDTPFDFTNRQKITLTYNLHFVLIQLSTWITHTGRMMGHETVSKSLCHFLRGLYLYFIILAQKNKVLRFGCFQMICLDTYARFIWKCFIFFVVVLQKTQHLCDIFEVFIPLQLDYFCHQKERSWLKIFSFLERFIARHTYKVSRFFKPQKTFCWRTLSGCSVIFLKQKCESTR